MASAKNGVRNRCPYRRCGVDTEIPYRPPFEENSAVFCQSVWLSGSILNFRIGSVSSIGGLIAATLFADTISDPQMPKEQRRRRPENGCPKGCFGESVSSLPPQ